MTKSPIALGAVICLSASLFLAGMSLASEEYDEDAYGPEAPLIWNNTIKTRFDHRIHTEDVGLECSACHPDIFEMEKGAADANGDCTMETFKNGKYCGACHNGDIAFDFSTQCESCHFPPKKKIVFNKPVKTVVFSHDIHVGREELPCQSCHKDVFVMKRGHVADSKLASSDDPAVKREYLETLHTKFCGTCHDSNKAFGYLTRCTVCHIGVKGYDEMNRGKAQQDAHGKSGH